MLAQRTRARKKKKKEKRKREKNYEKIIHVRWCARVRIEEETKKKELVELPRKTNGISNDRVSISS